MKSLFFFLFVLTFSLSACQQNSGQEEAQAQTQETSSYLNKQVSQLLDQYFVLKDALVATDGNQGQEAASQLSELLGSVDTGQIENEEKTTYQQHAKPLQLAVRQMADTSDIEAQRVAFEQVTAEMLALVKAFDPGETTVYYQFCPMAFDFKGAHWLSNEKKIMNPYFGDKMLHCGKVEDTF